MLIDIFEEFKHRKEKNEKFSDILNLFILDRTLLGEFFKKETNISEDINNFHYY